MSVTLAGGVKGMANAAAARDGNAGGGCDWGKSQPAANYILMEDDFPLCADGADEMMWLLGQARNRVPGYCGLFIATGGRSVKGGNGGPAEQHASG